MNSEISASIAAIVLAAGRSRRMGRFKPLLPLGGKRALERTVDTFADAGIREILVIVGHRAGELRQALASSPVRCIENSDYPQGMFTSVLAGIRALPEACSGFFVHPADIPLVRPQTVSRLAAAFRQADPPVLYPTFLAERGHPPLIRADLAPTILRWRSKGGLRPFLEQYEADSLEIPVADEAIVMDMDTAEDFQRLETHRIREGLPSRRECRALLETVAPPPAAVAAHCRATEAATRCLAEALNAAGADIDAELAGCAARLHDIARTEKNHAEAGARLLAAHGFQRLAPIVRVHMDFAVDPRSPLDEAQVVYLADKVTVGERLFSIEAAFAGKLEKFGQDPVIRENILRRKESAVRIQAKVERITGLGLDRILKGVRSQQLTNHRGSSDLN